jgi:hypothetical protein
VDPRLRRQEGQPRRPIPPQHSPRLKPRNEHGSPEGDHTRHVKEIGAKSNPVLPYESPTSSPRNKVPQGDPGLRASR